MRLRRTGFGGWWRRTLQLRWARAFFRMPGARGFGVLLLVFGGLTELARHTPPTREMSRYADGRWPILARKGPVGSA